MPRYRCRAYTKEGKLVSRRLDASGEAAAYAELQRQGLVAVDLAVEEEKKGKALKKLSLENHVLFCRSLTGYLKGGLNLTDALRLLVKQSPERQLSRIYEALYQEVAGGKRLAGAMQSLGVFREGLVGMVTSGEQSGSLVPILQRGAGLYRQEQMLRKKVQKALTYPVVMLFVGFGVVSFLMVFVVPKLAGLFTEMDKTLPLPTRILLGLSSGARNFGIPLLLLLFLGIFFLKRRKKKLRLPFFRNIREQIARSLVLGQTAALVQSGIPLVQALEMAAPMDTSDSARWLEAAELVRQGHRFASALEKQGRFAEDLIYVLRVGEMGNDLPGAMEQASETAWEMAESSMERVANLAEPLLVLLLALLVGFVVVAVLLPIFDISSLVGSM
ncbi:MAG TPA: type II secretion system F family protein [Synergistaceae bacterium]|nr:type II secretion system F family protein [Synergistaceae bacterium]HPQ38374.1 type II secretion system F family protein [Synergistaceae bacterium]